MGKKTISKRLTNQQLEDQFITAYEGGSNHWCGLSNEALADARSKYKSEIRNCPSEYLWDAVLAGESVTFYDAEDEETTWVLNLEKVVAGTEKMYEDFTDHYADAAADQGDAFTADVWLQLCLLDDVVY